MKLIEIKEILNCREVCENPNLDIDIEFTCASDLMSDLLAYARSGALLLTGLIHNNVIRTCEITEICAVIFVRGKEPPKETIKFAQKCRIPILVTDMTKFEACGLLYSKGIKSIPYKKD